MQFDKQLSSSKVVPIRSGPEVGLRLAQRLRRLCKGRQDEEFSKLANMEDSNRTLSRMYLQLSLASDPSDHDLCAALDYGMKLLQAEAQHLDAQLSEVEKLVRAGAPEAGEQLLKTLAFKTSTQQSSRHRH